MAKKDRDRPRGRPNLRRDTFVPEGEDAAPPDDDDTPAASVDEELDRQLAAASRPAGRKPKAARPPAPLKRVKKAAPAAAGDAAPPARLIDYEAGRKLTGKDKSRLAVWRGRNHGRQLDAFMRRQAEEARRRYGHRAVHTGEETADLTVCMPIFAGHAEDDWYPGNLSFEFVLGQNGLLLGLVYQLVAKPGVGKSALLAEFGRWFDRAGGGFHLMENETKFNPDWYRSIMLREAFRRMVLHRCNSVEDWQRFTTLQVNLTKQFMVGTKEEPGPGRTFPMLYGVDSVMGKMSEDTQELILGAKTKTGLRGKTGAGAADRGHPIEALKISRYLRTIPQELDNWPFVLVLVNHLRIGKDDAGHEVRLKAGGEQTNFQESFELELRKVGARLIETSEWDGFHVELANQKNSMGTSYRRARVRLRWWEEEIEGPDGRPTWEQRTVWDWDWAAVNLLHNILTGEKVNPRLRASLKASGFHLECPATSDVENAAWSRSLGMTKKDALPWAEVGALLRRDQAWMAKLRQALRIHERPYMRGDYLEQLEALLARAAEE